MNPRRDAFEWLIKKTNENKKDTYVRLGIYL